MFSNAKSCPARLADASKEEVAAFPENRITLQSGKIRRMLMASSIPLIPGSMTSVTRTSGGCKRAASNALTAS